MNEALSIQKRLIELGFADFAPTGFYGPKTTAATKAFQQANGLIADGIAGPKTLAALFPPVENKSKFLQVTQKAIDLIVFSEISSEQYYTAKLKGAVFPGLNSGITIGFGYDLGYNTKAQIEMDWKDLIGGFELDLITSVSLLKGPTAKKRLAETPQFKSLVIPYSAARKVFLERTLPRYAKDLVTSFPGAIELHPDAAGAMLSLVFNRGSSVVGPTRTEMATLKALIPEKKYALMAETVKEMKRLWDGVSNDGKERRLEGLLLRRDKEAKLIAGSKRAYQLEEIVNIFIS